MNIDKIKEIVNGDSENKRALIIWTLADDETIMVDLLVIAQAKHQKDLEMFQAMNLRLSESLHFIEGKCKPTPGKPGITREYLIEKIHALCKKFEKVKL